MQEEFNYHELQNSDRDFWQYHQENPHVYDLFKKFTYDIINQGFKNIGAQFIIERIRWETYTSNVWENLKINNNYIAGYSRLFMLEHPQHEGFFRTRKLKCDRNKGVSDGEGN